MAGASGSGAGSGDLFGKGSFVRLFDELVESEAFQALTGAERAVLIEFIRCWEQGTCYGSRPSPSYGVA